MVATVATQIRGVGERLKLEFLRKITVNIRTQIPQFYLEPQFNPHLTI